MKKLLLQYGLLVIANIVLGLFVTLAFCIFLFRHDPIMAAVPALLALPGLLLQPWFFLVLLVPQFFIVSPFLISLVTFAIYRQLNRTPKFRALIQRVPTLTVTQWLWTLGSIGVAGFLVMVARFKDIPSLKAGLSNATYELRTSLPELQQQGRFYQLRSFLNQEGLWQVKLDLLQLQRVVETLNLQPISKAQIPSGFDGMPPYWWRPQHNTTTQYFSTHKEPSEHQHSEGFQAIAIWNPGDEYLYLWYMSVF